jgi:hypothetical protein
MKRLFLVLSAFALAGPGRAEIKVAPKSGTAVPPTERKAPPLATPSAPGAEGKLSDTHRAAIERLLVALQAEKNLESALRAGAAVGMGLNSNQMNSLPKAQREKFQKALKRAMEAVAKDLNWGSIKEEVVEGYGKIFNEKEALEIAAILETPSGQLLVSKQNQLSGEIMRITQEKMKTVLPKLLGIFREEMQKPSE